MAEKGLSLRVILELIDKMSGPLKAVGANVESLSAGIKASMQTAKAVAPFAAVAIGAHEAGKKIGEVVLSASEAAEPLAEARTLYEQLAGAENLTRANAAALSLTRQYGVASWDQELTALAKAQQLYGNYGEALQATTAASRLALGTHADLNSTLAQLAITARNAGTDVDTTADKLAKLYQIAGAAGEGEAGNRQLQKALALASQQGVNLDRFLAITAVAEKAGLHARDLESYFEPPGKNGARGGARRAAVSDLINRNGADIARFQQMLANSADASKKLADVAAGDAAHQVERENLISTALKQAAGAPALEASGALDRLKAAFEGMSASAILAHPKLAQIGADFTTIGGQVLSKGGSIGEILTGAVAGHTLFGALFKGGAGTAAEGAAAAGETAEVTGAADAGAGLLGALAIPGVIAAAGIAAINYLERHPTPFNKGILLGGFGINPSDKLAAIKPAPHSTSVNVTSTPGPVTITVNVPSGTTPAQAQAIADAMKAALDLHDSDLAHKLAQVVSEEAKKTARTDFGG